MKKQTELDKYWADREDLKEVAQKEAKSVLKFAKGVAEELLIVHKDDMVSAIKEAVEVQINRAPDGRLVIIPREDGKLNARRSPLLDHISELSLRSVSDMQVVRSVGQADGRFVDEEQPLNCHIRSSAENTSASAL